MDLLEQFARGDGEAFEALFRQFQGEVYRWIVRIVRDPGVAEDLTVETFWRIYRAHARFDPSRPFGAWVRRVATNVAFDHLKRARPEVPLDAAPPPPPPEDPALQGYVRTAIAHAFRRLPTRLRVVATLALIEERPYEEIAAALGLSVGAVKSRAFRAVRRLRASLKQQGVTP